MQLSCISGSCTCKWWFGTSLYSYDAFINDYEEDIKKGDYTEDYYQDLPDSPEPYEIIDNSNREKAYNSYDHYIGSEVVLPDKKGKNITVKVRNHVKYDDISAGEGCYNFMHDKFLY